MRSWLKYNSFVPKFRNKYKKKRSDGKRPEGSDAFSYHQEKEDAGLRSSSMKYKDDIDSV